MAIDCILADASGQGEKTMQDERKPTIGIGQILSTYLGFLGLQSSFGLQQGNMGPI